MNAKKPIVALLSLLLVCSITGCQKKTDVSLSDSDNTQILETYNSLVEETSEISGSHSNEVEEMAVEDCLPILEAMNPYLMTLLWGNPGDLTTENYIMWYATENNLLPDYIPGIRSSSTETLVGDEKSEALSHVYNIPASDLEEAVEARFGVSAEFLREDTNLFRENTMEYRIPGNKESFPKYHMEITDAQHLVDNIYISITLTLESYGEEATETPENDELQYGEIGYVTHRVLITQEIDGGHQYLAFITRDEGR